MKFKENFDFDREYEQTRKHNVSESSMSYFSANNSPVSDRFNFGFTYNILPFNHRLEQKGNDNEHVMKMKDKFSDKQFYVGDLVSGYAPKDKSTHTGRIVNFIYDYDGVNIKYVYIIDDSIHELIVLKYNTLQHKNGKNTQYRRFDYDLLVKSRKLSESSLFFATQDDDKSYHLSSEVVVDDSMYINKFLDDEIYRQQIIKIIPFTDNIIKYFDEKFYTGKYQHNYFTIRCIDFVPFSLCVSADATETQYIKKLIGLFFNIYGKMTDNEEILNLKINTHRKSGMFFIPYNVYNNLKISSYKEIYMIVCTLQKIYRINRSNVEHFNIITNHHKQNDNYIWSTKDCNSKQWYKNARYFIIDTILPIDDYLKITHPDSTVTYEYINSKSFPDSIPNKWEEMND